MYKLIILLSLCLFSCGEKDKIYTYKVIYLDNKIDTIYTLKETFVASRDSTMRCYGDGGGVALGVKSISLLNIKTIK